MPYVVRDNIKEERCSNCDYNKYKNKCFICDNPNSDMYGLKTQYNLSCELWEGKNK